MQSPRPVAAGLHVRIALCTLPCETKNRALGFFLMRQRRTLPRICYEL